MSTQTEDDLQNADETWRWPEGIHFVRLPLDLLDNVGENAFRFWHFLAKTAGTDPIAWPSQSKIQASTGLTPKMQNTATHLLSTTYENNRAYLEIVEWARDDNSKTTNIYVLYPFAHLIPDEDLKRLRGYGHRFFARPQEPTKKAEKAKAEYDPIALGFTVEQLQQLADIAARRQDLDIDFDHKYSSQLQESSW
jgi:hypothetical protein